MTAVIRTLIITSFLFLMFSVDALNEIQSGVNFVTEAEAGPAGPAGPGGVGVGGPVGVGGVGVAGVARRTTRRVAR